MSDFSDAYNLGQQSASQQSEILDVKGYGQLLVAPVGRLVQSLERLGDAPSSTRGVVTVYDAPSFVNYLARFKDPRTVIFVNRSCAPVLLCAVLDYSTADGPSWGRHRVSLVSRVTEAWGTWTQKACIPLPQTAFAEFIEDHLPDIAQPEGSVLLDIVTTFEVKRGINVSSAIRLDNGQTQFVYDETVSGTAQRGTVLVPAQFILALAPFEGAPRYRVNARFRYRLERGALSMWVNLDQADRVFRSAVDDRVVEVKELLEKSSVKGIPLLEGDAPDERKPLGLKGE